MEKEIELTTCPDCGAEPGRQHIGGCDVARCSYTGRQYISCFDVTIDEDGNFDFSRPTDHGCTPDVWTGEWPGVADCRRLGWYTAPDSIYGYMEDLNRLVTHAVWNRELQRWDAR